MTGNKMSEVGVSILVLVDVGLRRRDMGSDGRVQAVSILVLVDVGLRHR